MSYFLYCFIDSKSHVQSQTNNELMRLWIHIRYLRVGSLHYLFGSAHEKQQLKYRKLTAKSFKCKTNRIHHLMPRTRKKKSRYRSQGANVKLLLLGMDVLNNADAAIIHCMFRHMVQRMISLSTHLYVFIQLFVIYIVI